MDTLDYIAKKFDLNINQKPPIHILNINRVVTAQTLHELGFKVGAEIGVAKGDHARILCQNNPGVKLYGIDPWVGYQNYPDYTGETLSNYYEEAKVKLEPYGCILIRKFSMDAVKDFEDESLDFVYIDGAHDFKNVTDDVYEWSKKVRSGGIVFGHDYKRSSNPKVIQHVVDVINGYTYALGIRPWFVLGTEGPRDGVFREGTRSWMWVKTPSKKT